MRVNGCNSYGTASYKGIEFEVESVEYAGGFRVLTHQYPFLDAHYNENLGKTAEEFTVSGFFHGKNFREKLWIAKRIWETRSNGIFYEPTQNKIHNVMLKEWSHSWDNKLLSRAEFTLTFVEKADLPYPATSSGIIASINNKIDEMINDVSDASTNIVDGVVGLW